MEKIVSVSNCLLSNLGTQKYNYEIFGISCKDDLEANLISLMLWAKKLPCSNSALLNTQLSKLTKFCKNCKPKKYKQPTIKLNPDYTVWYNSQEYLDCLIFQLINEGYVEDFCFKTKIALSVEDVCKDIAIALSSYKIDCNILSNIQVINNCKNDLNIFAETCNKPIIDLQSDVNCKIKVEISNKICKAILNTISNG